MATGYKTIIVEDVPTSNISIIHQITNGLVQGRVKPKLVRRLTDYRKNDDPATVVIFVQLHDQDEIEKARYLINSYYGNFASITTSNKSYQSANTRDFGCVVQEASLRYDENNNIIREFRDIGNFKYPFCENCGTDEHFTMEHRSYISSLYRERAREQPPATSNPVINPATNPTDTTPPQQQTNTNIITPQQPQPNTPITQRRLTVAARLELQMKK